jgi:hypothetical protein
MSHPDFQLLRGEDRQEFHAPGLRLTFLHSGDRWTHQLTLDGLEPTAGGIAASVEGDPARDNPARVISPAYQEIRPHPVEEGVCALLTGQSSPHHFSAVVTVRGDGPGVEVVVDVADRCRAPVEFLAATYLVQFGSGALIDAGPDRVIWGGEALGGARLEFRAGDFADVALAEAGRRASRVQALARLDGSTHTRRLVYSWRWTPADRS